MPRKDPRRDDSPDTVNESIKDRAIRHLLFLTRLQNGEAKKIVDFLDADVLPDLRRQIDTRLANIADRGFDAGPATTARLQNLETALSMILDDFASDATRRTTESLVELAASEAEFETAVLRQTLPIKIDLLTPDPNLLRTVVFDQPFDGKVLGNWWTSLSAGTKENFMQQIRIGLVEGETATQIRRRVEDVVVFRFRHNAEAITRSAVIATSANVREETYRANQDIIKGVQWVSTLDARTCARCMELDGKVFKVGEGPRPIRHLGCRCTTVPITKSFREMGFDVDDLPPGTRASMNGQVPATLTYPEWLRRQPADIQNEALGVERGKLFRKGEISIAAFTNRRGRLFTLDELRQREGL